METIYLLVAAECGWYGMVLLILWFLYYYFSTMRSMIALKKKPCCGIVIGAFAGLTCNYWHSTLEWSLKQYNNFAGQMILYALIGVIAVHRKEIKAYYQKTLAQKKQQPKHRKPVSLPPSYGDREEPLPEPPSPSPQETPE